MSIKINKRDAVILSESELAERGYTKVRCTACLGRGKLFPGCHMPVMCLKCGGRGYRWKGKKGSYRP